MKYNEIGKTEMYVSNLSFGASSLGGAAAYVDNDLVKFRDLHLL